MSPKVHDVIEFYHDIEVPLKEGEIIIEIASGQNHNIALTSIGRLIFWGSTSQN